MNPIIQIAPPFSQSAVGANITNLISTTAPTLFPSNFDYLFAQFTSSVGVATTVSFFGSSTNTFGGSSTLEWCQVPGWLSTDVTRTLITSLGVGAGVPRMIIIPVTFLYFYPLVTAYAGPGSVTCTVFGT